MPLRFGVQSETSRLTKSTTIYKSIRIFRFALPIPNNIGTIAKENG